MASPQREHGHIDIAHEIAYALMRLKINGTQVRLLWVIWRQTYGWHKKEDYISLSQFQSFTGLEKSLISKELKKLGVRNIIKAKNTLGKTTLYGFNKNYEEWENPQLLSKQTILPLSNRTTVLLSKQTMTVVQSDNKLLSKQTHTKEIKENTTKDIQDVFSYFLLKTNKKYGLTEDRKGIIEQRLKEGWAVEQMKKAIDNFVSDDWGGRKGFIDIIYCLGKQNGKPDNLEKWFNYEKQPTFEKP